MGSFKGPKGDDGDQGDPGPAGPNTVPTDQAIATAVQTEGSATKAALSGTIGTLVTESARAGVAGKIRPARPLVAFSFDDGPRTDATVILPILAEKQIKGNFAIITGTVGTGTALTWAEVRGLIADGHEVLNHSATHPTLTGATAAVLDAEINGSYDTFIANGVEPKGFTWPNGTSDAAARKVARNKHLYGIGGAADGAGTTQPLHTYSIGRYTLESSSAIADVKARIDLAVSRNEFLVFISHSATALNPAGQSVLRDAIDYVKASNVSIVTINQGVALMGNVFDEGDLASGGPHAVVDGSGKLWAPGLSSVLATNTVTAATQPGLYPAGVVSYGTVNNAGNTDWPVTGVSGNIVTDRTPTSYGFVAQQFITNTGAVYVRKATSGSAWGAWLPPGTGPVISATNGVSAATLPGEFLAGRVTYSATNSAGNTDWPVTATTSNIITDRTDSGSYAYVTQRFIPSTSNTEYIRRATSSTVWGPWTQVGVSASVSATVFTAATQPGTWPTGKETRMAVSSAGNTDWPVTGVVGKVVTDRTETSSYLFVTQRFTHDGGEYVRFATSSTMWGAWKHVALIA